MNRTNPPTPRKATRRTQRTREDRPNGDKKLRRRTTRSDARMSSGGREERRRGGSKALGILGRDVAKKAPTGKKQGYGITHRISNSRTRTCRRKTPATENQWRNNAPGQPPALQGTTQRDAPPRPRRRRPREAQETALHHEPQQQTLPNGQGMKIQARRCHRGGQTES